MLCPWLMLGYVSKAAVKPDAYNSITIVMSAFDDVNASEPLSTRRRIVSAKADGLSGAGRPARSACRSPSKLSGMIGSPLGLRVTFGARAALPARETS